MRGLGLAASVDMTEHVIHTLGHSGGPFLLTIFCLNASQPNAQNSTHSRYKQVMFGLACGSKLSSQKFVGVRVLFNLLKPGKDSHFKNQIHYSISQSACIVKKSLYWYMAQIQQKILCKKKCPSCETNCLSWTMGILAQIWSDLKLKEVCGVWLKIKCQTSPRGYISASPCGVGSVWNTVNPN